jgi:hypothetical protein
MLTSNTPTQVMYSNILYAYQISKMFMFVDRKCFGQYIYIHIICVQICQPDKIIFNHISH